MATRYFEKNDATKAVETEGRVFKFREVEFDHGKWYGILAVSDPEEIEALLKVARLNGVREMSLEDYRKKELKKKPETTSITFLGSNQNVEPPRTPPSPSVAARGEAAPTVSLDDVLTPQVVETEQDSEPAPKPTRRRRSSKGADGDES